VENTLVDRDSTRIDVENYLIDLEKKLDEISFVQVPKEKERAMSTPPVIQTPQNEQKNPKKSREEASTSPMNTSEAQCETGHSKRQRLNPVTE